MLTVAAVSVVKILRFYIHNFITIIVQQGPSPFSAALVPEVFFPFIFTRGILKKVFVKEV